MDKSMPREKKEVFVSQGNIESGELKREGQLKYNFMTEDSLLTRRSLQSARKITTAHKYKELQEFSNSPSAETNDIARKTASIKQSPKPSYLSVLKVRVCYISKRYKIKFTFPGGFLLFLIIWIVCNRGGEDDKAQLENTRKYFKELKAEFSDFVDDNAFPAMSSAVKTIVREKEPKRPAVISVINLHHDQQIAFSLGRNLASNISFILNNGKVSFTSLEGKQFKGQNPTYVTHAIEDEVHAGFEKGAYVVLFENFQYITGESFNIIHGLCDDTNAPFKNVVYIFTVNLVGLVTTDVENLKLIEVTEPWKKITDVNKRAPLESRIGTNKVFVIEKKSRST